MNISAASKAAGLPVKTVRYYADIGLVSAPSRSVRYWRPGVKRNDCSAELHDLTEWKTLFVVPSHLRGTSQIA